MFDELLQLVKDHVSNNPQLAAAIPPEQADAIHQEIATHLNGGLLTQVDQGGIGGLGGLIDHGGVGGLGGLIDQGGIGGLIGSLTNKFGLPPAVTGAIAASMPGLLQQFANRV